MCFTENREETTDTKYSKSSFVDRKNVRKALTTIFEIVTYLLRFYLPIFSIVLLYVCPQFNLKATFKFVSSSQLNIRPGNVVAKSPSQSSSGGVYMFFHLTVSFILLANFSKASTLEPLYWPCNGDLGSRSPDFVY